MRLGVLVASAIVWVLAAAPAQAAWTVQFRPYEAYATSSWPEVVKIADVTGDGRNDILLATSFYFDEANDYKLFLFAQRPDGSYAAPRRYDASGGIGAGDLDGDGDTDVAVATGEGVKVLWQSGGTLGAPQLLVNSPNGGLAEVADMNGDGRNDVVVSGDGLHVLTNRGGGAFRYSTIGIEGLGDIEVADVNGDRRLDVTGIGGGGMTQYLHAADGTYAVRAYGLVYGANGMGLADTTGDGRTDFAFATGGNRPSSRMVVIPQTAAGTPSETSQVYTSYDIPEPVDGHDLNGDGRADVVTLHGGWTAAGYYLQGSGGTLQSERLVGIPYASHYNLKGLDVGDLDCDGRPDMAIADYNHGLVLVRQVAPASRPATCPAPEPVPSGEPTPPPPTDPPPGGVLPGTDPFDPGSDPLPGSSGSGTGGGSSPPASGSQSAAGTHYGGAGLENGRPSGTSVSMLLRPDRRIAARVGLSFACRKRTFPNVVIRLAGLASGSAFRASGSTRLTRRGRLRVRMTGTLVGDTAAGRVRYRVSKMRGCRGFSRAFALRTERVPAGTAAMPAGGSLLTGLTGQAAGGIRLPVALRVTRNGRKVFALWQANMQCGPRAVLPAVNLTPQTRIRPDGTFSRKERYSIRYGDGLVERFRVVLRGRFLSDGAVGTLRARMQMRKSGKRYYPCESGVQRWTASP